MSVRFYIKTEPRMSIWGADFSKQQYQARPFFYLFTFPDVSSYLHGPQQDPRAHVLLAEGCWVLKGKRDRGGQEADSRPQLPGTAFTMLKRPCR